MLNTSSMFQPGLSQSSAWAEGLRGLGAARMKYAGPPGYEMRHGLFFNALCRRQIEHRISNTECRISKECVLPLAYSVNYLCGSIMNEEEFPSLEICQSKSIPKNNSHPFSSPGEEALRETLK